MKTILVIEDNANHLEDAKKVAQKAIEDGLVGQVDFATTYVEAKQLMESKKYDGIVSDIFFPYDESGWNSEMAETCISLLQSCEEYDSIMHRCQGCLLPMVKWLEGREMHPTGVAVASEAKKADVMVVFCTDTHHHGYATQPVSVWARENHISMIDCCPDDSNPQKDWSRAFESMLAGIKANEERAERGPIVFEDEPEGDVE